MFEHRVEVHDRPPSSTTTPTAHTSPSRPHASPCFVGVRAAAAGSRERLRRPGHASLLVEPVFHGESGKIGKVMGITSDQDQVVNHGDSSDLSIDKSGCASLRNQSGSFLSVPQRGFAVVRQDRERQIHRLFQIPGQLPFAFSLWHACQSVTHFM